MSAAARVRRIRLLDSGPGTELRRAGDLALHSATAVRRRSSNVSMAIVSAVKIRIVASCGRKLSRVPAIQAMSGESSPPTGDSQNRVGRGRPARKCSISRPPAS